MAAHRYWRIFILSLETTLNPSFCEVEMFTAASPAVSVCTGGTPFASSEYNSSWTAAGAFNGITGANEGWSSGPIASTGEYIGYDFGAGNEKDVTAIKLWGRNTDPPVYAPSGFIVQSSDDGSVWQSRLIVNGISWTPAEAKSFSILPINTNFERTFRLSHLELENMVTTNKNALKSIFVGEDGSISGTVSVEGSRLPLADVNLVHSSTGEILRTTQSSLLGEYKFDNLRTDIEYDVIAKDPSGTWENLVSSRRTPFINRVLKTRMKSGERATAELA